MFLYTAKTVQLHSIATANDSVEFEMKQCDAYDVARNCKQVKNNPPPADVTVLYEEVDLL